MIEDRIYHISSYPAYIKYKKGKIKKIAVECVRIFTREEWLSVIEDNGMLEDYLTD